jgi:hypothetical protein
MCALHLIGLTFIILNADFTRYLEHLEGQPQITLVGRAFQFHKNKSNLFVD